MGWECKSCGPCAQPLHGADEKLHCPNIDCDDIVTWQSVTEQVNYGWKAKQARGKAALAGKLSSTTKGGDVALRKGKCGRCKQTKTLQRSSGPTSTHRCHACNSAERRGQPVEDEDDEPTEPTEAEKIERETRAMAVCASTLAELDEDGLRRVLTYLGDRLAIKALKVYQAPPALPGPEPEQPVRTHPTRPRFEADDEDDEG